MFVLRVDEFLHSVKIFSLPDLRFYETHSDIEFINTLDEEDVCAAAAARIFEHVSEFSHE